MCRKKWKTGKVMFTDYNELIMGNRVEFSEHEKLNKEMEKGVTRRFDEAWEIYADSIGRKISAF